MGVQPVFDAFRTLTGAEPKVPWSVRARRTGKRISLTSGKVSRAASRVMDVVSEGDGGRDGGG